MNTIVGLSTTLSNSAINIIRISGEDSISIINKIFKSKSTLNPNEIKYGFIEYENELYDEVLVSFMKAPKSYTGEDVIEINCHGGKLITMKILNLIVSLGAKLAEAGEFTKRAFLNGKIDLTKAEAIIDLINAKSELELKCAINQSTGKLHNRLNMIKEDIINILSKIEVIVDFEDEVEDVYKDDIKDTLISITYSIQDILKYKDQGMLIKDGISTCIVGKPNAGKSSLLNHLCKKNKAIVTDIPGTTRDIIEERVNFGGIILNLFDTAGIRESSDVVESIGIDMAKNQLNESELILFVLDSSRPLGNDDIEIYNLIKDRRAIILLNKYDQEQQINLDEISEKFKLFNKNNIINISVKENIGFDKLEEIINTMFKLGELDFNQDSIILTNARHIEALINAKEYIYNSVKSLDAFMPLDIVSMDVRNALKYIMNITGEDVTESIIDNIFSKFCIGK